VRAVVACFILFSNFRMLNSSLQVLWRCYRVLWSYQRKAQGEMVVTDAI